MNPLEPPGFRPDRPGMNTVSLKRIGDVLLRGGLTPEDNATLKTSADLLNRLFQAPDLPGRPYDNIPLVGSWVERLQSRWRPVHVEILRADWAHQYAQARLRALMEAQMRARLWKQLCRDRGIHLRELLQKQLEDAINGAVMRDPSWAVECVNLLTHGKASEDPPD